MIVFHSAIPRCATVVVFSAAEHALALLAGYRRVKDASDVVVCSGCSHLIHSYDDESAFDIRDRVLDPCGRRCPDHADIPNIGTWIGYHLRALHQGPQ